MFITILICIIITGVVFFFVTIKPLFLNTLNAFNTSLPNPESKKLRAELLEQLDELKSDHLNNKLTNEEHEQLTNELKRNFLMQSKH